MKINNWVIAICIFNLVVGTSCNKRAKIYMTGIIDSMNGVKVKIFNSDFTTIFDSTVIENNKFNLSASLPSEDFYMVEFIGKNPYKGRLWKHPCQVYMENKSKYTLNASGPNEILQEFYIIKSSSFNQQKFSEYKSLVNIKRKKMQSMKRNFLRKMDFNLSQGNTKKYLNYHDSVMSIDNTIGTVNAAAMLEFITNKNNDRTLLTPFFICQMGDYMENYSVYKKILNQLKPEIKATKYFEQASKLLKSFENLRIGKKIPLIVGKDTFGNSFHYNASKYKFTLIDFWASYCYPCRQDFPKLKLIYNNYKNKGFSIVSISIDENKTYWLAASLQDSIPWYNISETVKQEDSKNIQNFVVNSIPLNYLLNERGQLVSMNIELDSLNSFLSKRLH